MHVTHIGDINEGSVKNVHAGRCRDIPNGVKGFLEAQYDDTGDPATLFFPPVPNYGGWGNDSTFTVPLQFDLIDYGAVADTYVRAQIHKVCGGNKNSPGCPYRKWRFLTKLAASSRPVEWVQMAGSISKYAL
jgi:hypothetical protein